MNSISQLMKYRRSMVEYALKHGITKTAIKYNTYRQYVYRWLRRYDGSLESLRNKSRRPKHHPKAHTAAELKLIQNMRRRNPEAGNVVLVSRNIELWHSIFLSQSVSVSPYCFCNKLLHRLPGKELRHEPGYD